MRHVKRPPRGLALALFVLLAVAMVALPAACDCRDEHEAFLCFTPASASLAVGGTLQVTATLQPDDSREDRGCVEKSGWRWAWESDDGGEIEFSQTELQWSGPSERIYVAQVQCTARKAGTVSLKLEQPSCGEPLGFVGNFSCFDSCIITVTTIPMMW